MLLVQATRFDNHGRVPQEFWEHVPGTVTYIPQGESVRQMINEGRLTMKYLSLVLLLLAGCDDASTGSSALLPDAESMDVSRLDAAVPALPDGSIMDAASIDVSVDPLQDSSAQVDANSPDADFTIWTGPRLAFMKPAGASPTSPEAQDVITDTVILTRGDGNILYNIAQEMRVRPSSSPQGTLWAMGTTADLQTLEFEPLKEAANSRMQDLPGRDMVLFLVDENIYIDLRFTNWRSGRGNGGGFGYERTTPSEN